MLQSMNDDGGHQRFIVMERRLFAIMTVGAIGSVVLGLWLWIGYWLDATTGSYWMHLKLLLVGLLLGFHLFAWRLHMKLRVGPSCYSTRTLKLINEVPAIILIAILVLVVVKPI
jgi:putative membrane protein